jgi:hypothetical protein
MTGLSRPERELLRRLADVGGKYTFRPDGETAIARRAFEQGIVATLFSLQEKQLLTIDMHESTGVTLPGAGSLHEHCGRAYRRRPKSPGALKVRSPGWFVSPAARGVQRGGSSCRCRDSPLEVTGWP